ncbi:CoA transferase [Mycolicibacterium sp. 018/SC-01/001]|uniref:CaiB/BaiF CoA transferase family protein n=1 Tax=Mycolicibacterium sp. 018/SC-01/001 TaxID=2592069 RepID=UPI0011816D73|nr:CaiB/BaiF CoA-transferase family protein [Mycolicibacterium sp. 018/SC-01/001]TRW76763.1 CoA transferase [Mycolicibacterium sp. 018/SC-01/001]
MISPPLAGVTVIALEQAVSAPMCTRLLADFGARVIKIENPAGGDFARDYDDVVNGQAAHFVWANRGKESVTIDLKSRRGREVLLRLLDTADVLVSNLAPGAMERLGLGAQALARSHPQVIVAEIDGYGSGGPLSHRRAYDLLVQAESGACAVTGRPGEPAKAGPPVADISAGLYTALSILALLPTRVTRTGPMPTVAVSLFDAMTDLMGYPLTHAQHSGQNQAPLGMGAPAVAPYGAYPTADGQLVVLGTTNDREWQRLARDILERDDLADDTAYATNASRVEHRSVLDSAIAEWCGRHELAYIQRAADAAGIGNARYNTPLEVVAHPHLRARDRWRDVAIPGGMIRALLPPPVISGYESAMGAVPALGEHTEEVLRELGLTGTEVAQMRAEGVLGRSP